VTQTPTLAIPRLTLTDFRNYAALRLETEAQLVALTGANGAGKTNILEAISLLGARARPQGRKLRRAAPPGRAGLLGHRGGA